MFISKYSSSGNDFLITTSLAKHDYKEIAKKLCNRRFSIGADGFIVVLPGKETDLSWQFYNCDGSLASMCGNGALSTFLYSINKGLIHKTKQTLLSDSGVVTGFIDKNIVKINMSKNDIITNDDEYYIIDTGVRHYVKFVDDLLEFDNIMDIKKLRYYHDANINYIKLVDKKLYVRTFEKGVEDETLACGTGISASFFALYLRSNITSIDVISSGGSTLKLSYTNGVIYYQGLVEHILDTHINI